MDLASIKGTDGTRRRLKIRLGRGRGTGKGKTCGRGHKGAGQRRGVSVKAGFEGEQLPLWRRLPIKGFNNGRFRITFAPVNLEHLEKYFKEGDTVDPVALRQVGLGRSSQGVKILGRGSLSKKLTVKAHAFSASAKEAIEKAGGQCEEIARPYFDTPAIKKAKKEAARS